MKTNDFDVMKTFLFTFPLAFRLPIRLQSIGNETLIEMRIGQTSNAQVD